MPTAAFLQQLTAVSAEHSLPCCFPGTGPCQAVLDARAAELRAAMLVYSEAEVMMELIQEADLSTTFNTAPGGIVPAVSGSDTCEQKHSARRHLSH